MPENFKKLYQGQPGTGVATIYTVPASTQTIVKQIRMVNPTAATVTIALFHDGTGAANMIFPPIPLGPGEFAICDDTILMETGDTLAAQASVAASITVTAYGMEIS